MTAGQTVTVDNWEALQKAVGGLSAGGTLTAQITSSLEADSVLEISGKTVILYTEAEDISIKRMLKSGANSTDPIFKLTNGAVLTIGESGKTITYLDDIQRKKSRGLFQVNSGCTLNLSNAKFTGLRFGYTLATSGYGAIYASNATVHLKNITMYDCTGDNGVLICVQNSQVTIENCEVTNTRYWGNQNNYGGVIYTHGAKSDLTINHCTITGCGSAEQNGAANSVGVVFLNGGKAKISNSTFSKNWAMIGPGICAWNTNLTLNGVQVTDNLCLGDGYNASTGEPDKGNITWWQGAGLYIQNCTLSISNTNIMGNKGSFIGGGMYITGTDVALDSSVQISGNSAVCGGGIYTDDSKHTITVNGAIISNNTAVSKTAYSRYSTYNGNGAGIANDEGSVVVQSGEISNNTADHMGGGIFNLGNTVVEGGKITGNQANRGGGILAGDGKVHLGGNALVAGNKAEYGNGAYVFIITDFEIQDNAQIDTADDVMLNADHYNDELYHAFITVSAPFTGVTSGKPISITSEEVIVEDADQQIDGTPLVLYTPEAGGTDAALSVDWAGLFIPSAYMQDGLIIGRSRMTGNEQWLTYVPNRTERPGGSLTVSKTVTGSAGETDREFDFTVTLTDQTIHGTYGDLTFNGGVAAFTLKHGQSKTAVNLPTGVGYAVTESNLSGYKMTASGSTGTIEKDKTATAAFTNHKDGEETPPTASPQPIDTVPPRTGDSFQLSLCLTLLALSCAGLLCTLTIPQKYKRK